MYGCVDFSSRKNPGFSNSHVWMWDLGQKEGWALKNRCFRNAVLEKTLENPLDCKEIQPIHPKGNQSWIFIGRTDAEAETPILWPPDGKNWLIWKDPDAGKDWRWEEKGTTEGEIAPKNKVWHWISCMYTYVPSLLDPSSSPHPRALNRTAVITQHWTELPVLYGSSPLAISFTHGSVYMSVLISQFTLPSPSLTVCLVSPALHLLIHRYALNPVIWDAWFSLINSNLLVYHLPGFAAKAPIYPGSTLILWSSPSEWSETLCLKL